MIQFVSVIYIFYSISIYNSFILAGITSSTYSSYVIKIIKKPQNTNKK